MISARKEHKELFVYEQLSCLGPKVSKGRPESPLAGFGAEPHFFEEYDEKRYD